MPDARLVALEQANVARLAAAELCSTIRAGGRRGGPVRAARAVQAGTSTIRIAKLLRAVPGVGDESARAMLRRTHIDGTRRLNDERITDRQRAQLVGELMAKANRPADG